MVPGTTDRSPPLTSAIVYGPPAAPEPVEPDAPTVTRPLSAVSMSRPWTPR